MRSAALVAVLGVITLVSGCNRDRPEKTGREAAAAGTESARALTYVSEGPYANVSLALPEQIKAQPTLHAAFYDEEVRKLTQFVEGSQADRAEFGEADDTPPYAKEVTVDTAIETPRLLSLKKTDYEFAGGAHPNTLLSGILWDKVDQRRIAFAQLFPRTGENAVLDQALCSAINAAKRERVPDSATLTLSEAGDWSCPKASESEFVLAAADQGGKAGGLTFLIGPYQVGPYAEGAYEVTLPLTVFRSLLAPQYAAEFGGTPRIAAPEV